MVWTEYSYINELHTKTYLLEAMVNSMHQKEFDSAIHRSGQIKSINKNTTQWIQNESSSGVILASWFTYVKDPHRMIKVPDTIVYIWKFYNTIRFLGLRAVIFHDHLPPDFVVQYATDKISFQKIQPDEYFYPNDLRFTIYDKFLEQHSFEWILMTDVRDVYFNSDPIARMSTNPKNVSLYISLDSGTFESNPWMKDHMMKCYPERIRSWTDEWGLRIFNCGVWGGHQSVIRCLLNYVVNELTMVVKGRGFCDMGTMNWWVRFGNCADKTDLEENFVAAGFVNPFGEECRNEKYSIIHNKCYDCMDYDCSNPITGKIVQFLKDI